MENEIDKRLKNCTFVKTILMIIVVAYHSMLYWSRGWFVGEPAFKSDLLPVIAQYLNTFTMSAFVLVSGYIYYHLKIEKGRYNIFSKFVKTKAKRLIVPYVFVAAFFVVPISVYFFNYNVQTIFKKYVLATAPSQLWFLVMLFDVFVIVYFMADLWDKKPVLGGTISIVFYLVSLVGAKIFPNVFVIWTACGYILYFYIGFMLRKYSECFVWKIPVSIYVILGLLLFVCRCYITNKTGIIFVMLGIGFGFLTNVVNGVMAFILLQKIANRINLNNKFLNFVSDKSMIVYLLHQQLIYFTLVWFNGMVNPYIHTVINFLFSFSLSLVLAVILKKFAITRFMVGEK